MFFFFASELPRKNKEVAGKIRKSGEIPSTVRKFLILVRKFLIFSDFFSKEVPYFEKFSPAAHKEPG